jgi:hypothetical protein
MWAIRIPPTGPPTLIQCGDRLEDLQALVGGNLETILGEHPRLGAWVALCDEDGHAKQLEPNPREPPCQTS